jgi:flagellar biosynthesis/type III secretory pathway protein FliH
MTAPHPAAALFPDLDLPVEDREEVVEDWTPDHLDEPELAFVPLFQQAQVRPMGAAVSAMLAEARDDAFNAGMAAGREAEQASRETAMAESLSRIADAVADARWAADAVAEQTAAEMARLVSEVIAHALPSLAAQVARRDVMAFAAGLLPALAAEPRIDIRVAPGLTPALTEQLATQPTIHVAADPALPEGDVRIGWRDGQAEHRHAAFRSAILGMIADLLAPAGDPHATATGTIR